MSLLELILWRRSPTLECLMVCAKVATVAVRHAASRATGRNGLPMMQRSKSACAFASGLRYRSSLILGVSLGE